jgi:hypothetical protein
MVGVVDRYEKLSIQSPLQSWWVPAYLLPRDPLPGLQIAVI